MKENKYMVKEERTVIRGITTTSKKVGCSPTHLSRVMSGVRIPGASLRKKLERIGIKFDEAGRAVL